MNYDRYGPPPGPPGGYQRQDQGPPRNYGPPQGPPQNYGLPQGPPRNYGPPQGPPQNYGRAQGPPQNYGSRNGPSGPLQDQQYDRPDFEPNAVPQGRQNSHGQEFAYSNNSGRRKALLIGINYFGSRSELGGCINDVGAMRNFLHQYGYKEDDMVILTDDQSNPRSVPTKQNIISAMQWLVAGARPNDCLVFHYSGHGGTTPDLNGDEDDGYDEVIYPVDHESAGHIVDDDMHAIMVRPLPAGCRLTAFFDSCHSGTALDLPFVYSTKGVVKEPNMYKDAGKGAFAAFEAYENGDIMGAFSSVKGAVNRLITGDTNVERVRQMTFSPADVISFSGCKDNQTSADASQGNVRAGAMSYAFLQVMAQSPNQTYISLLNNVRNVMMGKFQQKPQLSCSHPLDVNLPFLL